MVISGHQWPSVVIRAHQCGSPGVLRPRVVISGHQWPSGVIRGHQCGSPGALRPLGTVADAPPDLPPAETQSRRELRASPDDGAADGPRHLPPPAAATAVHTYSDVLRCNQVAIKSPSGRNQVAINSQSGRNQRSSMSLTCAAAISGHQWSSVVISGHQWPSAAISVPHLRRRKAPLTHRQLVGRLVRQLALEGCFPRRRTRRGGGMRLLERLVQQALLWGGDGAVVSTCMPAGGCVFSRVACSRRSCGRREAIISSHQRSSEVISVLIREGHQWSSALVISGHQCADQRRPSEKAITCACCCSSKRSVLLWNSSSLTICASFARYSLSLAILASSARYSASLAIRASSAAFSDSRRA